MPRGRSRDADVTRLILLGIIFHLVYALSIFDIYFRSPLVHGMTPQQQKGEPPAKRLVLIVGDGLRADKFYEKDSAEGTRAPFLRSIIEEKGSFGVSHTRVPTESRPGHVALIAGFYEDPSAVTKGWKRNPVEFDSFFNESRYTWAFGSPDILPMFADNVEHIFMEMYDPEAEDFAAGGSHLDTWVFDRVREMFKRAEGNQTIAEMMHEERIVFFLHLLGIDTNGHAYRPYSEEYYDNIRLVDKGVQDIVAIFEDYYRDNRTSFIFTADHGMSNKGSHGDGEKANTETPIVAWGAGVNGPRMNRGDHSFTPPEWDVSGWMSMDVNQADIAPLMVGFCQCQAQIVQSTLIGVPPPLNNVGVLPIGYLNTSEEYKIQSLWTNAKQILEQFKVKSESKKRTSLWFQPFKPLEFSQSIEYEIIKQIADREYKEAEVSCRRLIASSLDGLYYFQTYDWLLLLSVVSAGYIGWIAFVLLFLADRFVYLDQSKKTLNVTTVLSFLIFAIYLALQQSPYMYYLYVWFPCYFWSHLFNSHNRIREYLNFGSNLMRNLKSFLLAIVALVETLVVSFFYREILSLVFLSLAPWPLLHGHPNLRKVGLFWAATCTVTALFPLIPADNGANLSLSLLGGLVMTFLAFMSQTRYFYSLFNHKPRLERERIRSILKILLIPLSIVVVFSTEMSLQRKEGLPILNQQLNKHSVAAFPMMATLPPFHLDTLSSLFVTLAPTYVLLSISGSSQTAQWQGHFEHPNSDGHIGGCPNQSSLCLAAFFGTGNIASISSFEISSAFRFTTVFEPFLMTSLLVWKVIIPFALVALVFRVMSRRLRIFETGSLLLVVAFSDIMSLTFLFLIKTDGSWKDIGTSISHFAVSNAYILIQLLLFWATDIALIQMQVVERQEKFL
ncbi:GPI ethanolamine phosphate transferase 1 [Planoprotostelium fungivorum]|uniref:GPI ethanolamine phosphate transferase 1 n=1 Tax=Planoprotostelium fungivorum TaxID=1890364 RepID=A0A2P6P0H0_9EUKA|nr:GPI ethanolamine phosphate transferase 1 [Planoprotostelium fungivorum]